MYRFSINGFVSWLNNAGMIGSLSGLVACIHLQCNGVWGYYREFEFVSMCVRVCVCALVSVSVCSLSNSVSNSYVRFLTLPNRNPWIYVSLHYNSKTSSLKDTSFVSNKLFFIIISLGDIQILYFSVNFFFFFKFLTREIGEKF